MFSLDLFKTYFDIPYLIQSFALFKEWLLFTGRKSRWRTTKNNAYIPAKCRNDCLGRSTSAPRCQCQRRNWSVWKISSVERWCSGVFLQFTVKIEDECVLPNEKLYKKTWHTLLVCCKEEFDGVQLTTAWQGSYLHIELLYHVNGWTTPVWCCKELYVSATEYLSACLSEDLCSLDVMRGLGEC